MKAPHFSFVTLLFPVIVLYAAEPSGRMMTVTNEKGVVEITAPTFANVPYGQHPKQTLHFWKVESDKPAPLLFFIHGGSWTGGSRTDARFCALLPHMLKTPAIK